MSSLALIHRATKCISVIILATKYIPSRYTAMFTYKAAEVLNSFYQSIHTFTHENTDEAPEFSMYFQLTLLHITDNIMVFDSLTAIRTECAFGQSTSIGGLKMVQR